ncbi:hypothetical protein BCP78_0197 [Bacillus phage BCP78]|uniref:Protein OPG091 n=4 Tax=Tsarbombavirus TaxID=1985181 RepID=J9PR28_9CAUD|nr:enoyl-CoA hydratase/carnithine racemase-like [Bacillus phage BCP78]YP_009206916.1 enoyl-CoA hydratase/carnithine racemase-like [Bacillus phage TsarBomba]YP_009783559.1 hypothetical protein QLX27_gp186 [Bacillus phage BCU4]AQN32572.1 hypothetical protein BCP12_160 [Bacillus phage BCP12]AEW47204.1 hypothetical protein BCP78_0197 [Bacillus phage BCP78]AEW47692.1 hypothetical protein BCU4_0186 [Bacillus phage BCU4]ALA13030.1 hypothetical protein TSARBOMBA_101 [Bacillus phage TsarBomba]
MTTDLQAADVIFYRPTGFIGRVISYFTKSPYSHVALAINANTIIEADRFTKTRIVPIEYDKNITHIYRLENLTQEEREKIVELATSLEGTDYDYAQILEMFVRIVFRIKRTLFNNQKKLTCSEVVDRSFYLAGVKRKDTEFLYDVTPEELIHKYPLTRVL